MAWKPEYPGQKEPVWCWWDRDDNEDGLLGFHTKKDRDRFSKGGAGPFRRRISEHGKTIPQSETWPEMIDRLERGIDDD